MMIRFVFALLACLSAPVWAQRIPVYHNESAVTNQVVIADAFVNDGYFEVQNLLFTTNITAILSVSTTPYDMSGTKVYTNNGTFVGLTARFDNVDSFGNRRPADTFVNTFSGRIDFADGYHFGSFPIFQDFIRGVWSSPYSSVRIDARNIVNQGLMRIGAGGLLQIGKTNQVDGSYNADNIDLSSGLLVVDPVGNAYGTPLLVSYDNMVRPTSYLNDLGVYDVAWGMDTYTNQNQSLFVPSFNPTVVNVPQHRMTNSFGTRFLTSFSLNNAQSWGFTFTKPDLTNIVVQAVYIETGESNVVADVRWYPIAYYWNDVVVNTETFYTPIVKLSAITTNALTLQAEENAFYIADQFGAETNFTIIQNDRYPAFFRPFNYFVSRSEPVEFLLGFPSNTLATPNLYFPGYSNVVVTNAYSAYIFNLENLVYTVPPLPDSSVYDLPGRVEITGKSVDLSGTGIRGEGLVSIKTDNIASTAGAVIDAQNLAFDLTYTNSAAPATPLRIENLAKDRVARLHGQVRLWSGTFTNQFGDAQSNVFNVQYHVLVIDARSVSSLQEVTVADFSARTASLDIRDNMIVSNRFDVTARDVVVSGNVELRGMQWGTNLPNLLNLTIEETGSLRLVGLSQFGTTARPLANFINRGSLETYSASIVADNVDITGDILSGRNIFTFAVTPFGGLIFTNFFQLDSGPINIQANRAALFNGAKIGTLGDVNLSGPVYKLDDTRIDAGAALNLNISTALVDSGPNAGNVLSSSNSFALNTTVAGGSLLGTEINLQPAPRATFRFRWSMPVPPDAAALTNIPTAASWPSDTNRAFNVYATNMGVGHLVLHTGTNTVFEFRGTQRNRALFVDLLEFVGPGITNLTSLTNQLRLIADATGSIDIYYSDVIATNFTRNVNMGFQNLAEFLNGKRLGGGTLRWVPGYNGANTSEDVVIGGTSVRMNRPLRRSLVIDMDQDGIPNGNDELPTENRPLTVRVAGLDISQVNGNVAVTFTAFKGSYQVQYTDSMDAPQWKTATSYTHSATIASPVTLKDPTPVTGGPRFYRLIYTSAP